MIEVRNLSKRFGRVRALQGISFDVRSGEIVGLLGPNGAGKTTTLRILACFLPPSGGTVTVAGLDAAVESLEVRRRVGYLPENPALYAELRVKEYLKFRARLKGLHGRRCRQRVDAVTERCGLREVRRQLIGHLSRGYRQRVGLADSLLAEPQVLLLDEPSLGLDPNQRHGIRTLIKDLAGRQTVLLSSHLLTEIETVCHRVLILNRGRIVASDSPAALRGLARGQSRLEIEVAGPCAAIVAALEQLPRVRRVVGAAGEPWHRVTLECDHGADLRAQVFGIAKASGWVLRELHAQRESLEDVFLAITAEGGGT